MVLNESDGRASGTEILPPHFRPESGNERDDVQQTIRSPPRRQGVAFQPIAAGEDLVRIHRHARFGPVEDAHEHLNAEGPNLLRGIMKAVCPSAGSSFASETNPTPSGTRRPIDFNASMVK